MTTVAKTPAMRIEDRFERWHPFDPNLFDGTQLRYPPSHIERFPLGSEASRMHARMSSLVRGVFNDLVASRKVARYWECGDRDDWFQRDLMSEILPAYLQSIDEAERGVNQAQDVDYRTGSRRLGFGESRFHIDIPDIVQSALTVAEAFTPELPERDDWSTKKKYFFRKSADRRALVALREKHLVALRAFRDEVLTPTALINE